MPNFEAPLETSVNRFQVCIFLFLGLDALTQLTADPFRWLVHFSSGWVSRRPLHASFSEFGLCVTIEKILSQFEYQSISMQPNPFMLLWERNGRFNYLTFWHTDIQLLSSLRQACIQALHSFSPQCFCVDHHRGMTLFAVTALLSEGQNRYRKWSWIVVSQTCGVIFPAVAWSMPMLVSTAELDYFCQALSSKQACSNGTPSGITHWELFCSNHRLLYFFILAKHLICTWHKQILRDFPCRYLLPLYHHSWPPSVLRCPAPVPHYWICLKE